MHHVKGHLDDMLPEKDLDRWSPMNIEMDGIGKIYPAKLEGKLIMPNH
jgi:hypothetical protein